MQVAGDGRLLPVVDRSLVGDQREAGEAGGGHGPLHVLRGAVLGQGDELAQGHHDAAGGLLGELQGAAEQAGGVLQDAFGGGALDDGGDLLGVEGRGDLLLGLNAKDPQDPVGEAVESVDHGAEDARAPHQGRGKPAHGLLRGGDGDVLGHHLPSNDVQAHDDDQGDDDGDGVGAGVPDADGREQGLEGVGDGRLGDDAQAGGAQGHAELGGGQHARDVLQGPQGGGGASVACLGQWLELAAA